MEIRVGAEVAGRYVVTARLGGGGAAQVWRLRDRESGAPSALKVLRGGIGEELRTRLRREGRLQAGLDHPNLLPLLEVLALPGGGVGLRMALVEGPTLRELLARGPLPMGEVAALGAGLLAGVAAAHAAGLVHRDLTPANVLLEVGRGGWVPRVTDFGLARALGESMADERTRTGVAMGTPGYMAPEQVEDFRAAGPAADVFSLGCLLYELACGEPPFDGADPATLYRQACRGDFEPPRSLAPSMPALMAAAIEAALRPDPAARPADAGALLARWPTAADSEVGGEPAPRIAPAPTAPRSQEDTFVGRTGELRELSLWLRAGPADTRARLVTVLGPGGTGKTRLARQLALTQAPAFTGGVWFCDLVEARDLPSLCAAVARALGVSLGEGEEPVARLGFALAGRGPCLVILDNFEQIVGCAPEVPARWLAAAPEARFVVTSREVLGLAEERCFRLGPLPLPEGDQDPGALAENPSVALFLSRARGRRGFALTRANAADVAALVALLEGIPLAIELAAARAGVLTPGQILARMGQRFQLLAGRGADDPRHGTLRGAIDWSWELLSPEEQAAFARLSVFEGGFTAPAAAAVLGDAGLLQALADKSLVRVLPGGRFGLFVSLQEYAAARLATAGGEEESRARHGAWFAALGADAERRLRGPGAGALIAELDNFLAAARWGLARGSPLAADCALAAGEILERRGPLAPAAALVGAALAQDLDPERRVRLLELAGRLRAAVGQTEEAREALEEALALAASLGRQDLVALAARSLGHLHRRLGRPDRAAPHLAAAQAAAQGCGDELAEGLTLLELAVVDVMSGRAADSKARFEAAQALLEAAGDPGGIARARGGLGNLATMGGRLEEAEAHYKAAIAHYEGLGDRSAEASVHTNLGMLYGTRHELDLARLHMEEALATHRAMGDRRGEASALNNLAVLHAGCERFDEARACQEAALALFRQLGSVREEGICLAALADIDLQTGDPAAARPRLEQALALQRRSHQRFEQGRTLVSLAGVLAALGELEAAGAPLEEALAIHREAHNMVDLAHGLEVMGGLQMRLGRPEAALPHFEEALAIARRAGDPDGECLRLVSVGRVKAALGDLEGAREALEQATPLSVGIRGERGEHARELLARLAESVARP
jgi:predicted ATPase